MSNRELPKLAFLLGSTSSNGGIERVTSIIANQLIIENIAEIHAIGYHPREKKRVYNWNKDVYFYDLLQEKKSMKSGLILAVPKLRKYLKENNIDILIACGHIYTLLGFLGTTVSKSKFIYWSHSSFYGPEINKFKKINEHLGSLFSNTVITLTKTDKENYIKKTFARKVVQIYNPIEKKLLETNSPYNKESKKIISVGRLTSQKRFESNLLEVANKVLRENPDWVWHIYGKGELHELIEARIVSLGLTDKIILKGNVSNLYELYSDYSFMVMTSAYEGFPMSLLEGMANNLPLISFDILTGPNEIIENNVNGYLIQAFDCNQMAKKIDELIKKPELREQFSKVNNVRRDNFQIEKIINLWQQLIQ